MLAPHTYTKLGPAATRVAIGAALPQTGCREEGEAQSGGSLELPNKHLFLHKAENKDQTHQVRKHITVCPQPEQLRNGIPFPQGKAAGCSEVQECNCKDRSADPELLEAVPYVAGGFNEGSGTIQTLCTTPGSADTLLQHMGAPPVCQQAPCKQ